MDDINKIARLISEDPDIFNDSFEDSGALLEDEELDQRLDDIASRVVSEPLSISDDAVSHGEDSEEETDHED